MKPDFSVEKTIKARHSVRTYEKGGLTARERDRINELMDELTNPFSVKVSFRLLHASTAARSEKLGTYGVIKGANDFIGASVIKGALALEALGYNMETLILYITALGLGTCWLGGSFQRSGFATAMDIKENELFPVISPVGHPADKKRATESIMSWAMKSGQRNEWKKLFFKTDFNTPLTVSEAGSFAFPLEMVRLAPSAVNKQPWRIVQGNNAYHFYEAKSIQDSKQGIDIQRVDIGIAASHFHMAVLEKGLPGSFMTLSAPIASVPKQMEYIFSWVIEK